MNRFAGLPLRLAAVGAFAGAIVMAPAPGAAPLTAGPAGAAGATVAPASVALAPVAVATADTAPEIVVLLHGLGRTERSMRPLERSLEAAGYQVVNLGYPSRDHPVRELVDTLAAELEACCAAHEGRLDFVTHSLGGILVRAYQGVHGSSRIGRVVMLSPPNQGSEVVDRIPEGLLRLVLGPAALQLGTDSASAVHDLPPVDFELGILTGNATLNPLFSWWLPGDDDGKVTVESAWTEGTDDLRVVPYSHSWIMQREQVIEQVLIFLATGSFGGAA